MGSLQWKLRVVFAEALTSLQTSGGGFPAEVFSQVLDDPLMFFWKKSHSPINTILFVISPSCETLETVIIAKQRARR